MVNFQTRGTPWVILIDPKGFIVFSDFHADIAQLIQFLKNKVAK
jgi:hypothetical protein